MSDSIPVIESEWKPFHVFELRGDKIWVGDAHFAPLKDDGEVVSLQPGSYQVSIKTMDFNGDVRNSRLRFCQVGEVPDSLSKIGETWADVATQGICDFALYGRVAEEHPEEASDPDPLFDVDDPGVYLLAGQAELISVSSGFGDGTFDLYELLTAGVRSGVEVEMIKPGAEYPF